LTAAARDANGTFLRIKARALKKNCHRIMTKNSCYTPLKAGFQKYGILPPSTPPRNPCIESRSGIVTRKCALRHGVRCDSEIQAPQINGPSFRQNN
jgi:hypothetical protein